MQPGISQSDRATGETLLPADFGFGALFWTVRDAVIVGDVNNGRIALWNPAAERLFGYSAEEAAGLSIEELVPAHLKDRHRTGIASYAATGHGALIDSGNPVVLPALHRSGNEIFIEFSLSPIDANTSYLVAIIRDATERKRSERERDILLATAQDYANRAGELATLKADFTAMVAHELGTPIAAISALVALLEREGFPAADRQHVLATIRTQAHLLQRMVVDMGDAAAVERDDFVVHPQPTTAATLFADAAASVQALLSEHAFHVEPAPIARVLVDPERIGQVLGNLLGNAAKHTPPGTPVVLRARREDGQVHVVVADKGPGIHPDDLSRVLTKFGRGRDAEGSRTLGAGLGLYLSRRIIQAHGGDLTVESEPGKGTTFSFTLREVR